MTQLAKLLLLGCIVSWIGACVCGKVSAISQEAQAGIRGRVTSEDGAVFPDVEIQITETGRKRKIRVQTNGDGEYAVMLPEGTYDISAQAASFKPAKRKKLNVMRNGWSIADFVLKPGKPVVICRQP